MKEFKQTQKFSLGSPRKLRMVADLIKKLSPKVAVEKLEFVGRNAAGVLAKVVKGAMAQAKEAGISEDRLEFKEIQINEGPRLKRGRAASKGRWHPYKKRMSHIRVVISESKVTANKENKVNDNPGVKETKENGTKN